MTTKPDEFVYGGPGYYSAIHGHVPPAGLTKREFFAAMAMQGMIAAGGQWRDAESNKIIESHGVFARNAIDHADALIVELNEVRA